MKLLQRAIKLLQHTPAIPVSEFKYFSDLGRWPLPIPPGYHRIAAKDATSEAGKALHKARPKVREIVERITHC